MAHVTDFDCWHVSEEAVTVEMVVNTLQKNTRTAQKSIVRLVELLAEAQSAGKVSYCECEHALKDAIMTNPNAICEDKKQTLELLTGKYFK